MTWKAPTDRHWEDDSFTTTEVGSGWIDEKTGSLESHSLGITVAKREEEEKK